MADEQIIIVQPEEDLTHLRERLEQVQNRYIILVVQPPTQLRSHLSWRLLHSRVRELGKDVLVVTSDRQIRSIAKVSGFKVDNTMTSPPLGRTRGPTGRPVRRNGPPARSRSSSDGDANPAKSEAGAVTPPPIDEVPEEIAPQPGTPTPAPGQSSDNRFEIEDLGDQDNGIQPIRDARSESEEEDVLPPVSWQPPPIRRVTRPLSPAGTGPTPSRVPRPLPGTPARAAGTRRAAAGPSRSARTYTLPRSSNPRLLIAIALVLLTLVLLLGIFAWTGTAARLGLVPEGLLGATVTITPASPALKNTYVISAVTGPPIASQRQVQARFLSYTTSSQTATVKAAGVGHIPATAATGNLTLFNALPYPQTLALGTVFTDTNGIQVVSDTTALIPAAKPPAEGSVTVSGHAAVPGKNGNIQALDFNDVSCCAAGVTVQNTAAFSGGRDEQSYSFVQQSDIDSVVQPVKVALAQSGQASLKTQILANERLIGPVQCVSNIASDHLPGDRATSVTVTVSDACTGEVYDWQGAQSLAASLLRMEAAKNLGAGYKLIGKLITTVTKAPVIDTQGTVTLLIAAKGIWVFQFDNARKSALAKLIAGKSGQQGQTLLLSQPGVAKVDFQFSQLSGNTLPANPNAITIVVQSASGA
ncbi:MAG: hypothetical protein E6I80_26395 [Chloroflexi bacterium]|nr:MAG: hypothetical protein E6I80_26395 [Chloroflexota bacterium]